MTGEVTETSVSEYLHGVALDSETIGTFLEALAQLSVRNLSGPDEEVLVGITVLRRKKAGTVASSSERAQFMDELQYKYDDGPCLTACRSGTQVVVADLKEESRWPDYAREVSGHGMRSVLAVPFRLGSGDHAALNAYSEMPQAFGAEDITRAQEYADQASQALGLSLRLAAHRETESDLKAAMRSRTTIDLAVGIIMGQNQCGQDEALNILKSASSSRNVKLRDVAAGMVESTGAGPAHTHFDD